MKPTAGVPIGLDVSSLLGGKVALPLTIGASFTGAVTVPMTIRVPWGGGIHAPELHSDSPEAIYAHTPGLKIVIPSTPTDAKGLLLSAIRDPDPVLFFEPKRVYRSIREQVPEEEYTIPLGQAKVIAEGTDITILSWGACVHTCNDALDLLPEDVSAELIDLRTINPLDTDTIIASVEKTGRCVIVHEAAKTAGFGAEVAARCAEECMFDLVAPVERVTGYDTHIPLFRLEMKYLPSTDKIIAAAKRAMAHS